MYCIWAIIIHINADLKAIQTSKKCFLIDKCHKKQTDFNHFLLVDVLFTQLKQNTIMKKLFLILTSIILLNASCKKEEVKAEIPVIKANFSANLSSFAEIIAARENYKGEHFEITDIKRADNLLKISVEGPCDTEGYTIVWDGTVNFSEPPVAKIVVNYSSKSEVQCLAIMKRIIEVDLKDAFGNKYVENMLVEISNASKVQDYQIDRKGVTTKKNQSAKQYN